MESQPYRASINISLLPELLTSSANPSLLDSNTTTKMLLQSCSRLGPASQSISKVSNACHGDSYPFFLHRSGSNDERHLLIERLSTPVVLTFQVCFQSIIEDGPRTFVEAPHPAEWIQIYELLRCAAADGRDEGGGPLHPAEEN